MRPMQRLSSTQASMRRAGEQLDQQRRDDYVAQVADARHREALRGHLPVEMVAGASHIRTRHGWHEVVKVNRKTVRVLAAPGMDDLIPLAKVLEVRSGG